MTLEVTSTAGPSARSTAAATRSARVRTIGLAGWRWLALSATVVILLATVQAAAPGMVGGDDGYYHLKMAALMRTGLTPRFLWLPLTILGPETFVDHHWLFHVLLLPFTGLDLVLAGQVAAVVFAAAAVAMGAALLRAQQVPGPELWALVMLGSGPGFVYRMSMPRAQSLSLLWLLAAMHLLLTRRYRWLFPLGVTYVWLYDAFPLLPVLAVLYAVAHLMLNRRVPWGALAYPSLGVAAGLVANPFFPKNLVFLYHHLSAKIHPTRVPVGSEWYAYDTHQLVHNAGPALIALAVGALALGWRRDRIGIAALFALAASACFGTMLLESRRFVEYFPPFAVLFCALAVGPLLSAHRWRRWQSAAAGLGAALVAALAVFSARDAVRDDRPASDLAGAARWLAANTPQGALVFQTDWDDFPRLFFYNSHNTYTIGLDPTYLQLADPARYALWVDLTKGRGLDFSAAIRRHFGARYVVSDRDHRAFLARAADDPQLREVYRDRSGIVFSVDD